VAEAPKANRADRRLKLAAAAVAAATLAGAAIGAALAPPPKDAYSAETLVDVRSIAPRAPALVAAETRTLGALLRSTQARQEVATMFSGAPLGQPRIVANAPAGTVRILVYAATDFTARRTSGLYLLAALEFFRAEQARVLGTVALGDFERGLDGWQETASLFVRPSVRSRRVLADARFGRASLRIDCAVRGCGASRRVFYPFKAGVEYRFSAWVRAVAPQPAKIDAVAGVPGDRARSQEIPLGSGWTRLAVTWTPRADATSAEFALRDDSTRSSFLADGATFTDTAARAAPRPDAVVFARRQAEPLVYPARTTAVRRGSAAGSAAAGAGIGLGVGLAGVACFRAAVRQRRRQSEAE
jgi:hypothetical protein